MSVARRVARALVRRSGYHAHPLDDGWVVTRRLEVARIGGKRLGTFVVRDRDRARAHMNGYLNRLGEHLGEEHLAWVLRTLEVNCVLDVGANRGQFATRLRRSGYQGRIVSFEPEPEVAADLRKQAAGDDDWIAHEVALGDEEGTAQLHAAPGQGKLSSLLDASSFGRSYFTNLRGHRTVTIDVRRLDTVLDDAIAGIEAPRVFLKLDTQGFDLRAVRGAGERIGEIVGLQSEVSCLPIYEGMPRMPEQLTEYESMGFALSGVYPVTRHRDSLAAIEFDVLMVRAGEDQPAPR